MLAIAGDDHGYDKPLTDNRTRNENALELVQQIHELDAGAHYVVTQMFFNNQSYYDYVRLCREMGIEAPIIPALKVLTARRQLTLLPKTFFIHLPPELVDAVEAADDDAVTEVEIDWTRHQIEDLLAHDVPAIHLYVMQNPRPTLQLLEELQG